MKATEIMFIGYSLPVADFDFRYMLQKSVPTDASIKVILTQTSNPEKYDEKNRWTLPEQRYRNAFPKNEITFDYNGFGHFFS